MDKGGGLLRESELGVGHKEAPASRRGLLGHGRLSSPSHPRFVVEYFVKPSDVPVDAYDALPRASEEDMTKGT